MQKQIELTSGGRSMQWAGGSLQGAGDVLRLDQMAVTCVHICVKPHHLRCALYVCYTSILKFN